MRHCLRKCGNTLAFGLLAALLLVLCPGRTAHGYIEAAYSLAKVMSESTNIVFMTVESVDRQKNIIFYRKVRDLKGSHPGELIKHNIAQAGFQPREWQTVMAWAEPGRTAVMFHNGGIGETCIDNYWYQAPLQGDWWGMNHAEPYMLRTFAGKPEKLAAAVTAMLAGQEVVVPCMVDGDRNALQLRNAKLQRLRASLKLQEYNAQRDFVDWGAGADEFRPALGMPGFTHLLPLTRVGGAAGVLPADFNGDGRPDLCIFGATGVCLFQNGGNSFDEVRLPLVGGARAVAWGDYDVDGRLDLLLATAIGPRLFRNTGASGKLFEDVSAGLPEQDYEHLTAAAWIDYDGDGRPDILLADGFRGLRLYRNRGPQPAPSPLRMGRWYFAGPFDDTDRRGLYAVYPPEREIDLAKKYVGKNNEPVGWREGNFNDGQVNNLALFKPECNTNCAVYLYRELDCGGPTELSFAMGSEGAASVWHNGKEVYQEKLYHPCAPDQVQLKLRLRPGKNALLMKVCHGDGGSSFYFAAKPPGPVTPLGFEDVSDAAGLGTRGIGGGLKGDHLAVADFNGDGRPDILFSASRGLLILNTPQGFIEAKDSGISYQPGGAAPAVGDFNGDGKLDLFIPQRGAGRLFRGDGAGHFADVTAQGGDLAKPLGDVRCAAWAEFRKGCSDLFVGCWKGPNRYFRNNGDGTFTDATEPSGLLTQIFNTSGIAVLDLNKNKVPDLVLNNEGQEAAVLLCNSAWFTAPLRAAPLAPAASKVAGPVQVQDGPERAHVEGRPSIPAIVVVAGIGSSRDFDGRYPECKGDLRSDVPAGTEDPRQTEADATVSYRPFTLASILTVFAVSGVFFLRRCCGSSCSCGGKTLLLAAAILLLRGVSQAAPDWPTVRGNPQRTGNVDDLPGPKSPNVLWVYKTTDHFVAAPVSAGKAIYLPTVGALNTGGFQAVALAPQATERLLWSKTVPYITRPTVCAPAVADGLVVFGDGMHQTDDACLYCLQAETGLPLWQYPVPGKLVHLEAGPTIDRGRVYACGGDAGVMCIDAKRVTLAGKDQDLSQVIPVITLVRAEQLSKYEREKKKDPLLAIPPSDDALPKPVPKLLWQQGKGKWHIDAPPVVAGGFVLVASAYLEDDKVGKRCLVCLKAADGSLVWETPLAVNPWGGPTIAGQFVLVGCSNIRFDRKLLDQARGEVVAMDLATGQVRWRESVAGGVLSPIAVKGQTAVYTATDGNVIGRNCATGQLLWTYQAKHAFFAGPAIAGDAVYAADLNAGIYALGLADGKLQWTRDAAADPAIQSRSMVFGSPVVHGGDLYLATCNLDGDADQPSYIACLSDKRSGVPLAGGAITVDAQKRTVAIACRVAPRKLATLKDVYPLEVVATYPSPRGQKAHETIVTFECKPSEVHKALESLGLKPGKPARGNGGTPSGAELRLLLEVPGPNDRPRLIPVEKLMVDTRTGKTMPPLVWHFTGSVMRQPDPEKEDRVYGADFSGTLISLLPVTDETVCQAHLSADDGGLVKLDTKMDLLPLEGAEVKLILEAK